MISAEQALRLIDIFLIFDNSTGTFHWKKRPSNRVKIGDKAGTRVPDGYIQIQLGGTIFKAHRLVWLYYNQKWPEHEIDHVDRNPSNNRYENLRDVTSLENSCNIGPRNGASGIKGVSFDPNYIKKPWRVQIERFDKVIHRSHHATKDEAALAAEQFYQSINAAHQ